eukprot:1988713-Pyramimonas_sp.AAC.1
MTRAALIYIPANFGCGDETHAHAHQISQPWHPERMSRRCAGTHAQMVVIIGHCCGACPNQRSAGA